MSFHVDRRLVLSVSLVVLSVVCLRATTLAATPTPASSPSPAPTTSPAAVDQKVLGQAKSWYNMLASGTIDRSQLTKDMSDALTPEKVTMISTQLKQLGTPKTFTQLDTAAVGAYTVYHYNVGLAGGALVMTFALDQAGKIAGINLRPAGAAPSTAPTSSPH